MTGLPAIADDSVWRNVLGGGAPEYLFRAILAARRISKIWKNCCILYEMFRTTNARRDSIVCWFYLRHTEDPHTDSLYHGSWHGVITRRGGRKWQFGYDPIFFVPSEGKTARELTREEKRDFPSWTSAQAAAGCVTQWLNTAAQSLYSYSTVVVQKYPYCGFNSQPLKGRGAA